MKSVIKNQVIIKFPSLSCNEALARTCITAFLSRYEITVGELAEIKTAVSEAVTNCIVHAYRGKTGTVELSAIIRGNLLYIKVSDKGCGISDIKQAMTPLYTSAPEEERAGLGFAVMESFMDKVTVRSLSGKGTTVTMIRKVCAEEKNTL